ncbi:MAG TPA: hypothetical protein VGD27_19465 [Longimicrobiales bacterium]
MIKPIVMAGLVATVGAASHATDSPPEFGALRTIASPAPGGSAEPNLALGPNGLAYLSWLELAPDSGHQLRFAVLDGARFGPARTIARAAKGEWFVNWADFPSILPLSRTHLVAHWLERSGNGRYAYGVRVSRSLDGGQSWSPAITPHRDESASEHGFVSLFRAGNEIGIAWLDGRKHATAKTEAEAEMSVRYTSLGRNNRLTADVEVDARACDCCQTAAAITSRGPVLVYRDRSEREVRDIALVRYTGGKWTAPRPVHADNWVIAACPVNGPAVAARGNRVVVAWFTGANDQPRVKLAFSRNAGDSFAAPIRIDDGNPAGRVDVQLLSDNSAVVSWLERVEGGAEVRVRHVDANGGRGPARTVTTSSAERASGFPHMVVRGRDIVFAWTEPGRQAQVRTALLELK